MFVNYDGTAINDGAVLHNGAMNGGGFDGAVHGTAFDPGFLRPYLKRLKPNGPYHRVVKVNTGRLVWDKAIQDYVLEKKVVPVANLMAQGIFSPTWNATSLRKEEWINLDRAVVMSTRQRLRAWTDLAAASSLSGFNGMSKITHEYEAMTDPGEAVKDMEGITDGRTSSFQFKLRSIPLPITHSDFWFSERRIAVSRNSGTPLDTTMAEAAGRRVAEMVEKTIIGVETGTTFGTQTGGITAHDGTSTEYGYTNFPYRITKIDLNTPTGSNPSDVKQDLIEMRELLYAQGFFGPFVVYTSTGYDAFLDDDYFRTGGTSAVTTLRARIMEIDGIQDVRRLDFLTSGYQVIMVQMTSDVAQAIEGMGVTTYQWESQGGWRKNFKVACIMVGLLKAPYNGVAGIVHATTS